ncbi:MAG: TadE family protein [Planctomycetota bacterium]
MISNLKKQRRSSRRKGATTVEMAFCLPVLFLFLFASYEMARANMMLHAAESAAYEGARTGIVPGASQQSIEDSVAFVMNSVGASDFDVAVTPSVIQRDTETVRVEVSVSLRDNTILSGIFLQDPVFVGATEMKRESF